MSLLALARFSQTAFKSQLLASQVSQHSVYREPRTCADLHPHIRHYSNNILSTNETFKSARLKRSLWEDYPRQNILEHLKRCRTESNFDSKVTKLIKRTMRSCQSTFSRTFRKSPMPFLSGDQDLDSHEELDRPTEPLTVDGKLLSGILVVLGSQRDRDRNDDQGSSENSFSIDDEPRQNPKKLLISLGILGLFRGSNTDDLEEERERLSESETVKRMKPLDLTIARGVLSMCDKDHVKAEEYFHKALQIIVNEYDIDQETLILNLLATNYFESGELDKAEKLFIDLIKRMISQEYDHRDPAILELSLKLASIYSENPSTHDKATQGFKFVVESLLMHLADTVDNLDDFDVKDCDDEKRNELALLGWTYDWFAKHLMVLNDYKTAVDVMQRALEISTKVLGPLHEQTLILLNDVGTTMAMAGTPELGMSFIKKAVEGAIKSQSKELASFYVNLGLVNLKLNKLNEAKRYCEYSIELASKNEEHYNFSEILKLSKGCLRDVDHLLQANSYQDG